MVKQTSRGRNQDINATAQFLNLRAHRRAAINNGRKQANAFFEIAQALSNLVYQFTRRRQNKRARLTRCRAFRIFGKTLQQRQAECSGFTTTRLGNPHQVTTFKQCRNGFCLNLGRCSETGSFNVAQQGLDKVEPFKISHKGKSFKIRSAPCSRHDVPARQQ